MIDLILGTAGHIDHGKTSLVRALTGVDTDRLPEEKRRGITIDLGFAELTLGDYRLGIVDVPGHERFVRNMLAGASGVDLALLTVAADDSIKPQTREHLEILRLLDLQQGVIALTKCDLVEDAWLQLVEEEIRSLTAGTFLAEAPIVRTSVVREQGLEELRAALQHAACRAAKTSRMARIAAPFRMAIDRSFTLPGHGAIVTGSIASGRVRVGDALTIEPGGIAVRVRNVQVHDRAADEAHRGQRAALNLAGVRHEAIRRGQEVAAPGGLCPSRLMTVHLALLDSAPRPLKSRDRVRVHLGTAELLARVSLLGPVSSPAPENRPSPAAPATRERLAPGEVCLAQFFFDEPAVAVWGQPLVVRSESPIRTIGGGRVLDPCAAKIRRDDEESRRWVSQLLSSDETARASAALYLAGLRPWQADDLARSAGVCDTAAAQRRLAESGDLVSLRLSALRTISLHRQVFALHGERVFRALEKMHDREPLRMWLDRSRLASLFRRLEPPGLFDALLESLVRQGRVRQHGGRVGIAGRGPKLSKNEQKLFEQLVTMFRDAGFPPPSIEECQAAAAWRREAVPQLLAIAAADGLLVEIAPGFYVHEETDRALKAKLAASLAGGSAATAATIRDLLGATRKHVIPYCEYLDRTGFTRREGDLRRLAEAAPATV